MRYVDDFFSAESAASAKQAMAVFARPVLQVSLWRWLRHALVQAGEGLPGSFGSGCEQACLWEPADSPRDTDLIVVRGN